MSSTSFARNATRISLISLGGMALVSAGTLGNLCGLAASTQHAYNMLANSTFSDGRMSADTLPEQAIAWLEVEGTTVSYPVAELHDSDPDSYYLTHTLWGAPSAEGCPYLDRRSSLGTDHILIYGHHLGSNPAMFTTLAESFEPALFAKLGRACLATRSGTALYQPYCALSVPATFAPIQQFSFSDGARRRAWLLDLADQASATSSTYQTDASRARRVLSLVTCTEGNGHSSRRTIVVFILPGCPCTYFHNLRAGAS